jgi:hypothetical protein
VQGLGQMKAAEGFNEAAVALLVIVRHLSERWSPFRC